MFILLIQTLIRPQDFSRGSLFRQHQTSTFAYVPPSLSQNLVHLVNSESRHVLLILLVSWYVSLNRPPPPPRVLLTLFKAVTPAQPANFLFKIESDVGQGAEGIDVRSFI